MPTTRTVNPLHFEDLEPHRFEDLVRQIAYEFREWDALEAVGRAGSDEGVDILGREVTEVGDLSGGVREWVIQCKREHRIPPAKAATYVRESLRSKPHGVYGYILAAATDFSAKARNVIRETAASLNAAVVHIWGKAELEDMLFRPENDHLLFAYFGMSLQPRRRSQRSLVLARLAVKKKLVELFHLRDPTFPAVMVRDAQDDRYPWIEDLERFIEAPGWKYYEVTGHRPPDHLEVVIHDSTGWYDPATEEWDFPPLRPALLGVNSRLFGVRQEYWEGPVDLPSVRAIPENRRARMQVSAHLPYDRILAVDDVGDAYNEAPHLLIQRSAQGNFFDLFTGYVWPNPYERRQLDHAKRIEFFATTD